MLALDEFAEKTKKSCVLVFGRKVITALALQPSNEPQGRAFSIKTGLSPSGIKKCLKDLQKLDMIYVDKKNFYRVLDPVIAYFIRRQA